MTGRIIPLKNLGSGKKSIFVCERGTLSSLAYIFLEIRANEVTTFVFKSEPEGSRGYLLPHVDEECFVSFVFSACCVDIEVNRVGNFWCGI